jgi:hypothetical protein
MLKRILKWFAWDAKTRLSNRNHTRYINWLSAYAPDYASGHIELKRVKTTVEGINFYLPTDLLMITGQRKTRMDELSIGLGYGMTREELLNLLEESLKTIEDMPFDLNPKKVQTFCQKMQADLKDFIWRVKNINTERIILEIALCLFFIEDENPYQFNELTQNRKRDLALKDDDLRAFFLQTTLILLRQSTNNENAVTSA